MNVELLQQIKVHILEEPRRLDMDMFFTRSVQYWTEEHRPPCGSVGCIAGWATVIAEPGNQTPGYFSGRRHLDIDASAADRLFYLDNWPEVFRRRYYASRNTPLALALATAARIDHFIATEGRE